MRTSSSNCQRQTALTWVKIAALRSTLPGGRGGTANSAGSSSPVAGPTEGGEAMNEILILGLVAIAVVIVMAGLLGRLVDHDDVSSYVEG